MEENVGEILKQSRGGKLLILNSMAETSNLLTVLMKKCFVGEAIFQRKKFKWLLHTPKFGVKSLMQ